MIRPSAPRPRWRSQVARARAGRSAPDGTSAASSSRKSLPNACALMTSARVLRDREAAEHPGQPGGEPETGVARRHADDHARRRGGRWTVVNRRRRGARRGCRCRAAARHRSRRAGRSPRRRLRALADGARERQAVGQHVVLPRPRRSDRRGSRGRRCRRPGWTARSCRSAATRRSRWYRDRGRSRSRRSAAWSRNEARRPDARRFPTAAGSSCRSRGPRVRWSCRR